ncbi:MAG TPA: hypothetical protein VD701_04145 [Steroidobacteraceae bacterium]|nr:hypothetical protein [Steroidobacteraceae bacterium]
MFKTTLTAAMLAMLLAGPAFADDDDDRRGRGGDRDDRYDRRHDDRDDDRSDRRDDRRDDRRHDRRDDRRDDRRFDGRNDRRNDGYWHDDVRRYFRDGRDRRDWRDHRRDYRGRDWRYLPPVRWSASFGYRAGYEAAWDDWGRYGRYDRKWRRHSFRGDHGFRAGYEAGWRDAARYYGHGYRPRSWDRDPRGGWYFGFHIDG